MFKHKLQSLILIGILIGNTITINTVAVRASNEPKPTLACDVSDKDDDTEKNSEGESSGVGGDWLNKGNKTNDNAQKLFDYLTKKKGFSGAGASGALAVAKRESMFDPTAVNPGGGVAGIFQWSGFSNNVNGDRITRGGFIKAGDKSTLTLDNELKLTGYELDHELSEAKKVVGHAKTPEDGAKDWSRIYEGVALSDGQSKVSEIVGDAKLAYKAFGGANINADDNLIGSANSDNGGFDDKKTDDDLKGGDCKDPDAESNAPDGTGSHKEPNGSTYRTYSDLPDDLKKYAFDPEKLIGKRGDGSKWPDINAVSADQCVGLSVTYGNAVWGLKGNHSGNGVDMANSFAKDTGTEVVDEPHAGAISGQTSPQTPAGHTFVVQHVFSNGDVLVVEQNFPAMSGQANNEKYSWNFRIIGKADLEKANTKYAMPNKKQKTPKWQ